MSTLRWAETVITALITDPSIMVQYIEQTIGSVILTAIFLRFGGLQLMYAAKRGTRI
jgi:hypothetical protein